jgi:hypothetical protein
MAWITQKDDYIAGDGWGFADVNSMGNNLNHIYEEGVDPTGVWTINGNTVANGTLTSNKNGADAIASGANITLKNTSSTDFQVMQLGATGDLDWHIFNAGFTRQAKLAKTTGAFILGLNPTDDTLHRFQVNGKSIFNDVTNVNVAGQAYNVLASSGLNILTGTGAEACRMGYDSTQELSFISSIGSAGAVKPISFNPLGGNVLIGTVTDSGHKLNVNGTGNFSSSLVAATITTSSNNSRLRPGTAKFLLIGSDTFSNADDRYRINYDDITSSSMRFDTRTASLKHIWGSWNNGGSLLTFMELNTNSLDVSVNINPTTTPTSGTWTTSQTIPRGQYNVRLVEGTGSVRIEQNGNLIMKNQGQSAGQVNDTEGGSIFSDGTNTTVVLTGTASVSWWKF